MMMLPKLFRSVKRLLGWRDPRPGKAAAPAPGGVLATRRRVAVHEAGHVIAARCFDRSVALATIVPGDGYVGRVWGGDVMPDRSRPFSDGMSIVYDVCEQADQIMPRDGEQRECAGIWYLTVLENCVDSLAGLAAEELILGSTSELGGACDYEVALRYASTVSTAPEAFLTFVRAEARALLGRNRSALLAIADALGLKNELAGPEIDAVILRALAADDARAERARRQDMTAMQARVAAFSAESPPQ